MAITILRPAVLTTRSHLKKPPASRMLQPPRCHIIGFPFDRNPEPNFRLVVQRELVPADEGLADGGLSVQNAHSKKESRISGRIAGPTGIATVTYGLGGVIRDTQANDSEADLNVCNNFAWTSTGQVGIRTDQYRLGYLILHWIY